MRPKSEIYTPKQDGEHPRPFHTGVPPPPPYKQQHVYFVTSNDSGLTLSLALIKISCTRPSVTWLTFCSEIAFVILENLRESKVLILLGNLARWLKFGPFEIISRKSLLFLPRWNMIHMNFFCCLARDCNYRDENLHDVNFKSGLYCTRQNIVFKAPGRFWSFRNFYVRNHVSKKTEGELSKGGAIAYRKNSNSSQEVKLQSKLSAKKKHPHIVDTDKQLR